MSRLKSGMQQGFSLRRCLGKVIGPIRVFCLVTFVGMSLLQTTFSLAKVVAVPGTWYDQDKYHLTSEPNGGDSWGRNYGDWLNGDHDPGEPVSETIDWDPWETLDDNSCWMASAANMVQHRTGADRYHSWAYDDGITGDFIEPWTNVGNATYTFDEGGYQHYCLEHEGCGWTVMAQDSSNFAWLDPIEYITACLKEGSPVGIGIFHDYSSGHALTVYSIDTGNQTLTVADSDADASGQRYTDYTYSPSSGDDITIAYPTLQINLRYICAFDDVGWWTEGSGTWHVSSNWASSHTPTSNQAVYLTQSNVGTISIHVQAYAKSLSMSEDARLEIVAGGLNVTNDIRADGVIELFSGANINARDVYIGYSGTGTFTQTGETNAVFSYLCLGYGSSSSGTYELSGTGQLSAEYERVGNSGMGTFTQTGGTNTVGSSLNVGLYYGSNGTYELSGTGQLSANDENIGGFGTGTFTQTGGTNTVDDSLRLGDRSGSSGTYTISAGQLTTASLYVGYNDGSGTLNITDPAAIITVSSLLYFGPDGTLAAVPGSAIHMTGSAFENESTDADAMAGLANLTLIFEGGLEDVDPFEVAGEDMGAVWEGFDGNFAMDTLQLGVDEEIGQVQLVDSFDNQPEWTGSEAMYVENLLLGGGSLLDLNGFNLYFHSFINLGGTIELGGGNLLHVSLPGDANHDDVVNDQDASVLAAHWQQSGMDWEDGDFNNDGIVNDADASILAAHWQQTREGEGTATVPEPTAIILCLPLCLAGLLLGRRRYRS